MPPVHVILLQLILDMEVMSMKLYSNFLNLKNWRLTIRFLLSLSFTSVKIP